jgi:hypothetical protein
MYEIATLFKLTDKIHNYISSHFSQLYEFLGTNPSRFTFTLEYIIISPPPLQFEIYNSKLDSR